MNWDLMDECEKLFDQYNIKPVMGVIPHNQDQVLRSFPKRNEFWEIVKNWQNKGWEISMHGYNHIYGQKTYKKDYFRYGGRSEFYGEPLHIQLEKINKGLEIFKKNKINIRSFFAPNHTYDENTFVALKKSGIFEIIDGYGFRPYTHDKIKFIPQLFYKLFFLPIGLQTTQIHLNEMSKKDFNNLKTFINKKNKNIISYDDALKLLSDKKTDKILNKLIYITLFLKRKIF